MRRADLTGSDTEVVVAHLLLEPGARTPLHTHPVDEHLVALKGGEFTYDDGDVTDLEDGMARDCVRDVVHGGFTLTGENAVGIYTIHIVENGVPVFVLAE